MLHLDGFIPCSLYLIIMEFDMDINASYTLKQVFTLIVWHKPHLPIFILIGQINNSSVFEQEIYSLVL